MRLWLIFSHHVIILNLQEIFSSEINFRRLCGCKQKRHVCFVSVRVFSVFFVVVVRFRCKDKYVYILCKWRPGLFVYSSSSFSSLAYVSLSVCVCVSLSSQLFFHSSCNRNNNITRVAWAQRFWQPNKINKIK